MVWEWGRGVVVPHVPADTVGAWDYTGESCILAFLNFELVRLDVQIDNCS